MEKDILLIDYIVTVRSSEMIPPNESLIHLEFILELREKEAREKIENNSLDLRGSFLNRIVKEIITGK